MPTDIPTAAGTMTPTQAGQAASRARKLLRDGRLTPHDYAVFDALLWCSRAHGRDTATEAYSRIAKLAHVAHATAVQAIGRLVELGLVQRIRRRALVVWHNGGRAWRQLANVYRFIHCESAPQPDSRKQIDITVNLVLPLSREVGEAQAALARIAREREAQRAEAWRLPRMGRTAAQG